MEGWSVRRIVCFGDSVTRGITLVQGRMRILKENYPALLQMALGRERVDVINQGVFNDNSDKLVERLEADVLSVNPDYVLIEIGGNDCNFNWGEVAQHPDDEHQPVVPLDRYVQNVKQLVLQIQKRGPVPIVLSLPPLDPARYYRHVFSQHGKSVAHWIALCGGIEYWHGNYNQSLNQMLSLIGAKTVDIRKAFTQLTDWSSLLSEDGIHPSADGYQLISRVLTEALMPYLTEPAGI